MPGDKEHEQNLSCSFCGKKRTEVKKLIAGPNSYICNECINISHKIINEEDSLEDLTFEDIPTPEEIKAHLDDYVISQEYAKEIFFCIFLTNNIVKNMQKKFCQSVHTIITKQFTTTVILI